MIKPVYTAIGLNRYKERLPFFHGKDRDDYLEAMTDGELLLKEHDEVFFFEIDKCYTEDKT